MSRGFSCVAHKHDSLVPIEIHHVWPTQYHGPNIASNKLPLCANAHSDVHYLLEALLGNKHPDLREYGAGVRTVAFRGYAEVMAYAESLARSSL